MEVIIEQLGTTNNVLERHKFDAHRVRMGRAFSNDVILNDEHVDAVHAQLEFDDEGRLFIEDLGSVNGIRRPRHKARIERTEVNSGEVFLVGRSRVRIFAGTHPVPPAVRIRASEVFLLWLGKPQVMIGLVLLYLVARVTASWLGTIGEFSWSLVIEQNLGEMMLFLALAVGVYFLSVLFRRGGNFLAHISLLVLLFLFSTVLDVVLAVAMFNADDAHYPMLRAFDEGRGYLELLIYLWSVLYLAFHLPLGRRSLISVAVVATMIGINSLPEDELMRFIERQSFPLEQRFLPPGLLLRESLDEQVFERDFEGLFEQIERERVDALQQRDEASEQAIEEALEDVVEEPVDQDPQIELSSGPLPPRP
jgi:pSer/pThr/pTyr-binding forkhead associated (FHA) protein